MTTLGTRIIALSIALLAGAALVACGDDAETGPEVADLETVIAQPPAGFQPLDQPFGPFDLSRYLADFANDDDAIREYLTEADFERGLARGWLRDDGVALAVFVFVTEDSDDASGLRDDFIDDAERRRGAREFDVEGIDDAQGVTYVEARPGGVTQTVHAVLFVRGPRLYNVAASHPMLEAGPELALEMARAEAAVAR